MRYDYKCSCGHIFEDSKSVAQRHTSVCPKCGRVADLLFRPRSLSAAGQKFIPYVDTNISPDGEPMLVESRSQKRQLLKQQGLDWLPGTRWV